MILREEFDDYGSDGGDDYSTDDSSTANVDYSPQADPSYVSQGGGDPATNEDDFYPGPSDLSNLTGYASSAGSGATSPDIAGFISNGDGTYTDSTTGITFDSYGQPVDALEGNPYGSSLAFNGGGGTGIQSASPEVFDIGGGQYLDMTANNVVDANGNILATGNPDGTYTRLSDGGTFDPFGFAATLSPPPANTGAQAQTASPGSSKSASSGGTGGGLSLPGGGSSSGSSSSRPASGSATTAPTAAAAIQKTIISDQRIGNDRYLVYSDGSSQRISNYYAPAVNAAATTPPNGSPAASILTSLFGTVGAVTGTPATGLATSLSNALGVPTSATAITGRVQQPVANNVANLPSLSTLANSASPNPPSLLLIVGGILAAYFALN